MGGAIFEAIGPTALFLIWGGLMGILLLVAVRRLTPGREDTAAPGLARGRGGH
jgi:hypothetical protein